MRGPARPYSLHFFFLIRTSALTCGHTRAVVASALKGTVRVCLLDVCIAQHLVPYATTSRRPFSLSFACCTQRLKAWSRIPSHVSLPAFRGSHHHLSLAIDLSLNVASRFVAHVVMQTARPALQVDPKYVRNMRFAKRGTRAAKLAAAKA